MIVRKSNQPAITNPNAIHGETLSHRLLPPLVLMLGFFLAATPSTASGNGAPELPAYASNMQIRNVAHDRVLRPRNAGRRTGNPIVLYPSTSWRCLTWKCIGTASDGVKLENYFTSKGFAPNAEGVVLQTELENASTWIFEPLDGGSFRIRLKGTDQFLTAPTGNEIIIHEWTGDTNQQWRLEEGPDRFSA